jgi:hypothetical protein
MSDHAATIIATLAGEHPINDEFVDALIAVLGVPPAQARLAVRAAVRSVGETQTAFEMRTGQWRIDLNAAVAKAVACASVSTVALESLGQTSVTASVLSIVAPFLFEIDRIEISAEDVWLHARLVRDLGTTRQHIDDAYDALPADLRSELSMPQFVGLIERLEEARLASTTGDGIALSPSGPGSRGFRLYLS